MVKIKIKHFLISLVIFTFLMSVAHAAGSKLIFDKVDVEVGGSTSRNLDDGDTISDAANPEDTVEFRITVKNNFTSSENIDIEDITVQTTIEGIDDGDDLEDESSEFNLRYGRDKKVTFRFQVPLEVEEDSYNVVISAEGRDENGTTHEAEMSLSLDVDKETHKVIITRKTLTPSEVTCSRKSIQAGVSLLNIGTQDEDDVSINIFNYDLGVDIKEQIGEITSDTNDDSSSFSKTYSFGVPANAETGSYPITLRVLYNDDRKKSEETMTLTVNQCGIQTTTTIPGGQTTIPSTVIPTTVAPTTVKPVIIQPLPDTTITEESFFTSNGFVILIIIAEVIAVIVGIVLIIFLFAR